MGKRRSRNRKGDLSTHISDDVLRMVLDELTQRDVLSLARVCRRWRAVAVQHHNYYRFIRFSTYRGGVEHFVSALRGASATAYRLSVSFNVEDAEQLHKQSLSSLLDQDILPAVKAALGFTVKLNVTVPDTARDALYAGLGVPAPLLNELCLKLEWPWSHSLDDEEGETEEDAILAEAFTEVPLDVFGGHAPRLQTVSLSGFRLGTEPISAFAQCRRLSFCCEVPLRRLHLNVHFPALAHLEMTFWYGSVPENTIPPHALRLPGTLTSLNIRAHDEFFDNFFPIIDFDRIPDLRILHEYRHHTMQLVHAPYLNPLRSCRDIELGVSFEQTYKPRCDYWSYPQSELPRDVRVSLVDCDRGIVRTFYADDDLYDATADMGEKFEMFGPFSFLTEFTTVISKITIVHEFIPLLYQHFESLPALSLLEIDMDVFRGAFWATRATEEFDDYWNGDRTPPPWPKSVRRRRPKERRRRHKRHGADSDSDSAVSCDSEGYTHEENYVIGIAESNGLLNCWDEEPERRTISCPALKAVRLRTTYEDRAAQTRQLAHFGRSLGFLERPPQDKPQLFLRGVRLACAKHGKLHLKVFREVVEEPVVYLKKQPGNLDHGYISPAHESYSDESGQASN
ncbi:hypothetical protein AURDEDRAFT_183874 [Auricularia subglabra TFB-10046 SS5]|nr:hypothetical protein AURDEDRAFT_183874 [Auricularia subglabra TFB-10046 SS5]